MSTFSKSAISGYAAEYFVAYTVTKCLGWMCRLPGVDIGIDAEIEITDGDQNSVGRFIKVQVKGIKKFRKSGKATFKPTKKQMKYWQDFAAPVIFCCVDHENEKVYWKIIWMTSPNPIKIEFTRQDNILDASAEEKLRALVTKSNRKTILECVARGKDFYNAYKGIHEIDADTVKETERDIEGTKVAIDFLHTVAESFPWFIDPQTKTLIDELPGFVKSISNLCNKARTESSY